MLAEKNLTSGSAYGHFEQFACIHAAYMPISAALVAKPNVLFFSTYFHGVSVVFPDFCGFY